MSDVLITLSVLVGIIVAWFGSLEYRIRTMNQKVNSSLDRADITELIDLKIKFLELMQADIKQDTKDLNAKLDRLLDSK